MRDLRAIKRQHYDVARRDGATHEEALAATADVFRGGTLAELQAQGVEVRHHPPHQLPCE